MISQNKYYQVTPYSGLKNPCFSHQLYHAASTYCGLYASGMGPVKSFLSPGRVLAVYNATSFVSFAFFCNHLTVINIVKV